MLPSVLSDCTPQASHRILETTKVSSTQSSAGIPSREVIDQLHDLASKKLRNIIKTRHRQSLHSDSSQAELIAAKELLDQS